MNKNLLWGAVGLVATATVAQVWLGLTPAVASAIADSVTVKEEVRYIRERVDQIYDEVKK